MYRNRDVLINALPSHMWWTTLKSTVIGLSSPLPPLVGGDCGLVSESVGNVDLLSEHFASKQSREPVVLPPTCHPPIKLMTFAFRSCKVRRLMQDLEPYDDTDPLGMLPLFLKRTADVLAPGLSVVFRRHLRLGSFPVSWRQSSSTIVYY